MMRYVLIAILGAAIASYGVEKEKLIFIATGLPLWMIALMKLFDYL